MESLLNNYEQLLGMRLFHFEKDSWKTTLPYDLKTNNRIGKDVRYIGKGHKDDYDFYIHSVYPQCYILVWPNLNGIGTVFSEMFFVAETKIQQPTVCCEKCSRSVDTSVFKGASHHYLHLAGEALIKLSETHTTAIRFHYSSIKVHDHHSCDSVCKDVIMDEIHMTYNPQNIKSTLIKISHALINGDAQQAKEMYYDLLIHLKSELNEERPHQKIQGQFSYIMTALTYELAKLLPDLSDTLFGIHHRALTEFMSKEHYSNQIIFAQDFIDVYIKFVSPIKQNNTSSIIQKALQIVHKDYASPLKLTRLAHQLHIDESYLSRQFKKEVGRSFSNYLMHYRLRRALLLMNETTYPLTDIAIAVGFDSSTYFATCFKKVYQLPPSKYRKEVH